MGIKYLWDTNTTIYYLQQQFPSQAEKFIDDTLKESQPFISVITEIELLCWKTDREKDLEILRNFIDNALVIIELDRSIKLKTEDIRKQHKIRLPDAIIAATALAYDLVLLTRNTSDFKNIPNLKILDPHVLNG
jgi:predicted nucleic acid-binding protein